MIVKCQRCGESFSPRPKKQRICVACIRADEAISNGLEAFMKQPEIQGLRAGIQAAVSEAYKRTFGAHENV
jgi:hypothetical protein